MESGERWSQNERETVAVIPSFLFCKVLQKRSEQDVGWCSRMGGEEMADSGFLMEEDVEVELDSGFCIDVDLELSLGGQVAGGSDEHPDREELDWFVSTGHADSPFASHEQKEESPGGVGGSQTSGEGETEADSGLMENGETEAERGVEMDDQSEEVEEEEMEGSLDVCLWPVEESGGHVRISLEEVERYYRFGRCCHWLCGRFQMFYHLLTFLVHKMSLPLSVFLSPCCIYLICFCGQIIPFIILSTIWVRDVNTASSTCPFLSELACPLPLLPRRVRFGIHSICLRGWK